MRRAAVVGPDGRFDTAVDTGHTAA
jgi:hypothetical protein